MVGRLVIYRVLRDGGVVIVNIVVYVKIIQHVILLVEIATVRVVGLEIIVKTNAL